MASLIRLKQIESSSGLISAANVGANLETTINGIVANSLTGSLLTSSINIAVSQSINTALSSSITNIVSSSLSGVLSLIATDIELAAISASITATGKGFVTTGSFNSYTQSVSQSFSASSATHTQFSASLDSVYATDYEVYVTSSQIIDQGEF